MQNYESRYWGLIYDQMMERELGEWLEANRSFYATQLAHTAGPVLECACGSGLILLHLLDAGLDVHGFDISASMLAALRRKRPAAASRVTRQTLDAFRFDSRFDAIVIPTNSFSMLTTREQQLATLQRVFAHLEPGGRLLMDLRLASSEELNATADGVEGRWHEWDHPGGGVIRQRIVAEPHDFARQVFRDRCFFEYGDDREDFPMEGRWIFEDEMRELLHAAGFTRASVDHREWGSYWTAGT